MDFLTQSEIERYKIPTNDIEKPVSALGGYFHWLCPRCKKALHAENGRFVSKCLDCGQAIKW